MPSEDFFVLTTFRLSRHRTFLIVRRANDAFPTNFTPLMAQATWKSRFRKWGGNLRCVVKLQRIVAKLHNASHLDDYLLRRSKLIINYVPAFYPSHLPSHRLIISSERAACGEVDVTSQGSRKAKINRRILISVTHDRSIVVKLRNRD